MLRLQPSMIRNAIRPALSGMRRCIVVRASSEWNMYGPARSALFSKRQILADSNLQTRWMSSEQPKEGASQPDDGNATAETEAVEKEQVVETEKVVGEMQTHGFKAETRQLLDIVAKSLYHDKEVFIRELVSNASDALEKARYLSATNAITEQASTLEINISVNKEKNLFIIQDNGIGMSSEELMENLGTIARSGSKAFLNEISQGQSQTDTAKNIIGKFGVGFYSSFMVADKVTVYSRKRGSDKGYCWLSAGDGTYQMSEAEGVEVGTKIILHLRDDCSDFATSQRVRGAVTKYSSFVSFPVTCNGEKVNDVQALWLKDAASITKEEHSALYRHISGAYDEPGFHLVYKADAPIDIKSVFYIPSMNIEKMGLSKAEAGVHLYSRRVLIQHGAKDLLPEWLRFVKGVVDSEDLPLSISRENMQDVSLLQKLKAVLTRRICRWLADEAKRDPKAYLDFHGNFSLNLKEGVATDRAHAAEIAKLMRYPTTALDGDALTSFEEYVGRMKEGQQTIYYIVAANRKVALGSPYYEAFKRGGYEVLLCYHDHDEVVLQNLAKFADKEFKSIETVEPPAPADADAAKEGEESGKAEQRLSPEQETSLLEWLKETLGPRVKGVEATKRLVDSPAVIADHDSAVTRKLMQMAEYRALGINRPDSLYRLQVNLAHPILLALDGARRERPDLAALVAHQVLDNAVMSAGIMDDARDMLPRLSQLMQAALKAPPGAAAEAAAAAPAAPAASEAPAAPAADAAPSA